MRVKPYLIIRTFKKNGSVSSTSRELGIHRSTVYRWLTKLRKINGLLSEKGLKRKSTKPQRVYHLLGTKEQSAIIKLREETGFSAVKIKGELSLPFGINTIHRLLKKKGLLNRYGNYIRPRYQKTTHMHLRNTTKTPFCS